MIRSIAGSIARPLAVAITGASGGTDLAADVRALFTANGGAFDGTMLDFGKTSRLFSDFAGTEAANGDTLALVLDDQQNGALGTDSGDAVWTDGSTGTGTASITGRAATISGTGPSDRGIVTLAVTGAVGEWARISLTGAAITGSNTVYWNNVASLSAPEASFPLATGDQQIDVQFTATTMYIVVFTAAGGSSCTVTLNSAQVVLGNHASQSSSGSRPALTTDPVGTLVAQPDGTDDYMDLPDGVLGDGADAISVSFAIAPNEADSDANARLIAGASGAGFEAYLASGDLTLIVKEGGTANTETIAYGRAVTDNETIIATFQWAPSTAPKILVNGVVVAEGSSAYATLDDPGAPDLFGVGTATSLACTCHGAVSLVGTALPTTTQRETVEAYLADLASDTLLTADADTVLSRWFRPATDLNVTDGFLSADWTDNSAGSSSITVNAGANITFSVVAADAAIADRTFRTRVGYRYTITSTSSAGVTVSADESTAGGTTYGTGASISFVATTSTVYIRASTTTDADTLTALVIDESAATGDYWDMLDETKRFTDAGSTQAGPNDDVQQINSEEGDYPLTQTTAADQATLDGTATNLVFDGSTDFYVATDASDDLVQTGDTTEIWAVTPDVSASARVISSAGDSTVATDTASVFSINGSDQLSLQQADATSTETETTAITVTEGSVNVISYVRDGANVDFGIGADQVESETFATVTTPTAGTSPAFNVGISVDQSSGPYDGSIQLGLKVNLAAATGRFLHSVRAMTEKTT